MPVIEYHLLRNYQSKANPEQAFFKLLPLSFSVILSSLLHTLEDKKSTIQFIYL